MKSQQLVSPEPSQSNKDTSPSRRATRRSGLARLRNYLIAGTLVMAPIAITFWIVRAVIGFFDSLVDAWVPARWQPDTYLPFAVPGLGAVIVFVLLIVVGFLTANFIGRFFVNLLDRIVSRVPGINMVYQTVKQIFDTVLASRSDAFREVVLIEYPRKGLWAIAFRTADAPSGIREVFEDASEGGESDMVSVFLPTTPNPTSGFLLYLPRTDIKPLDLTIEEGVKLVVSSGLVSRDSQKVDKR